MIALHSSVCMVWMQLAWPFLNVVYVHVDSNNKCAPPVSFLLHLAACEFLMAFSSNKKLKPGC